MKEKIQITKRPQIFSIMARTKQIPKKSTGCYPTEKVEKTKKTKKSPSRRVKSSGQEDKKMFKVAAFTKCKVIQNRVYFKVHWAGYDKQTWEPATRLKKDMPDHFDVLKAAFNKKSRQ